MKWWKKRPKKETEITEEVTDDWNLLSEKDLLENQDVEVVEDIVDTKERVIGKELETKLTINESQKIDLSVQDRVRLTKRYTQEEAEEERSLEEIRKIEENRANHVKSIQHFIYGELSDILINEETTVKIQIDSKFEPFIKQVMDEIEISYDIKENPRNQDLVKLNPEIPLVYEFKIRSDEYAF